MTIVSRATLDRELADLNANILRLASQVELAIEQAFEALENRDVELAQTVITRDDEEVNPLRFEIERQCFLILATQQPAAGDLRVVISALHVSNELERIGDHAAGIARLIERLDPTEDIDSLHKLPKMAKRAREMVSESIQAYSNRDREEAYRIMSRDYKLDRHYNRLVRETLEEMRDESYITRATYLIWIGHNLERIGDRATNIAERVIFMIDGKFVENVIDMD
jgi:phosphate transport system protein